MPIKFPVHQGVISPMPGCELLGGNTTDRTVFIEHKFGLNALLSEVKNDYGYDPERDWN
jgi:hypothetical protein